MELTQQRLRLRYKPVPKASQQVASQHIAAIDALAYSEFMDFAGRVRVKRPLGGFQWRFARLVWPEDVVLFQNQDSVQWTCLEMGQPDRLIVPKQGNFALE